MYTVKKVVEATDDTTIPGGTNNDSKVAQYNQTTTVDSDKPGALEINKKNIALDGRPNAGRFSSVYGNDATIYLTAELAEIEYKGHEVGIIDDVANVTTGVKNANLTVWSNVEASKEADEDTNPASNPLYHAAGVYTLYKSNGYIIAAVVVGEDDAASKNLVYTHTDSVEQESYDKATDEWTWTRKVVMNGEEVTLTEISDDSTYLESMAPNTWYEVKLNAEGNVIGRTPIAWAGTAGVADAEKYINEDIDIAPSVKAEDTVLYSEGIKADQLSMIGSTLYVKTTSETGFFVAEDVNIVLQQLNRKKMETTFDTGVDNLEDIVDSLNERYDNQKYDYTISAILEDGAATTVIIRDTADPYEPNEPSYTGDGTANGELVLDGLTGTVYQRKGDKKVDVLESIEEYFGVTNIDDLDTDGSGNYKVKVGNKTYTIADTAVELGEVTLVSQYAPNVAVTSATDVYLAKGESVTVTLYYAGGVLSQNNVNTAATNHAALKVTDGSLSRDQKTITLTLTATADFNADRTVQIQWS